MVGLFIIVENMIGMCECLEECIFAPKFVSSQFQVITRLEDCTKIYNFLIDMSFTSVSFGSILDSRNNIMLYFSKYIFIIIELLKFISPRILTLN